MPSNPNGINIRVVQVDAGSTEPWDEPINTLIDGFKTAAVFFVETGKDDILAALWRDGDDLRFRDVTNPGTGGGGYTLAELLAGSGGLTVAQHKTLRQLIHFIDSGPADGFPASGVNREISYPTSPASPFPSSVIWYEDAGKTKKIVELTITRNANQTPSSEVWKMYDTDGTTVLLTVTDTISYNGILETTRTRGIA